MIYRLKHFHKTTETRDGDAKTLGCFSSMDKIEKAKKKYRNMRGFSEYPYGFCVFEQAVSGEKIKEQNFVYIAEVYIRDETFEFEREYCIGAFWDNNDAEKSLKEYICQNHETIDAGEIIVDCTVTKCKIDKMEWIYGFK